MGIVARYSGVEESFGQDALRLLHQRHAPLIVAVLGELYDADERRSIAAVELHAQVDGFLDDLSQAVPGIELPRLRGRDLAYSWVEGGSRGWLRYRDAEEPGGTNVYDITTEALDALRYVRESRRQALVSESRVKDLIAKVQNTALLASEDRERKVSILTEQIEQLTRQRDELLAGGEMEAVDDIGIVEALDQIVTEVNALPSDIRRVAERFAEIREQVRQELRESDLSQGDVLDQYRQRMDELMADDRGRAFNGAVDLMRQTRLMRSFTEDMETVLNHDAAEVLRADERQRLKRMSRELSREIHQVIDSHTQIVRTISRHLVSPDQVQARELRAVLRELDRRLAERKAVAPVRERMTVTVVPPTIETELLRTKYAELIEAPPPPLLPQQQGAPMRAAEQRRLARMGAPDLEQLRGHLVSALAETPEASIAEVFNALPDGIRRLVDLLGLFEVSSGTGALARAHRGTGTDVYRTVHPLGESTREFVGPRLTYSDDDRAALTSAAEKE